MAPYKIRVFLADDHAVLRKGLEALINSQPDMEVVGEASNGQEACQKIHKLHPDVAVIDLSMPVMDGFQAINSIKQICPGTRILVFTVHEDTDSLRVLLRAGASGCVLKSGVSEELAHAIRRIVEGGIYLDPILAEKLVRSTIGNTSPLTGDSEATLSEREIEVLRLLSWGHSNGEIAEKLHLSVRTVETYRTRSMEKLKLSGRADIVRYAVRRGWLKDT